MLRDRESSNPFIDSREYIGSLDKKISILSHLNLESLIMLSFCKIETQKILKSSWMRCTR